jgi:hypothetical protein
MISRITYQKGDDMENSKYFYSGVTHIKVSAAMALLVSSISTAYALDDGRYTIKSSLSGMYLDVYGRSSDDGANIIQYRQTGGTNQQFDVHALGDGTYSIRPAHSGKSLDVFNWNANDGAELRQWTYTGGSNQRWHIDDVGNGLYSITSAFSGKAIDVAGMSKALGADVQLYTYWSGGNQLWSFVPVGSTPAPNPSPNPTPNPDNGDSTGGQTCDLPSKFSWTSTDPLITPRNPNWLSIKDPTIVKYNNQYHVFASVVDKTSGGYGGVYMNFSDWSQASSAQQTDMSTTQAGGTVAPQVFYFEPHNKWYLIYQWGAKYSTNSDISNPNGWSAPKPLLSNGLSNGIDYWVICDDNYCHLFFSGDDGNLYRSKVSIGNFPNFSGYEIVMRDSVVGRLFEASNVYKVDGTNKYLLLVEAYGPRYFRSWTSTSLDGPWTPLADTQSNPFAGTANVSFSGAKWTNDISHGEMIRSGYNQKMTINTCDMQYLYQGVDPNSGVSDYNRLPWKLGLIKAK